MTRRGNTRQEEMVNVVLAVYVVISWVVNYLITPIDVLNFVLIPSIVLPIMGVLLFYEEPYIGIAYGSLMVILEHLIWMDEVLHRMETVAGWKNPMVGMGVVLSAYLVAVMLTAHTGRSSLSATW